MTVTCTVRRLLHELRFLLHDTVGGSWSLQKLCGLVKKLHIDVESNNWPYPRRAKKLGAE